MDTVTLPVVVTSLLLFHQVMEGAGEPRATHVISMMSPSTTLTLRGRVVISGARAGSSVSTVTRAELPALPR